MLTYLSVSSVSAAKSKPVVAEPEIHGGQSLEGVTGFLLLMSEGLINALESAHGPEQANQVSRFILRSYFHLIYCHSIYFFLPFTNIFFFGVLFSCLV